MATAFARVTRTIWGDDDFRDLPQDSQWLYFHLLTSPGLNHAGVTDWRPARIAALARGLTPDAVESAAVELECNLFIVIDRDSEEALIRSFIRHDGLMDQPNMATAMSTAHAGIASRVLRGVIVHELRRLHADDPDLNGWKRVLFLTHREAISPSEAIEMLPGYDFINPSVKGSVKGSTKGSVKGSGTGSVEGSVKGCLTPSPTPSPSPTPHQRGSDTYLSTEGRREIGASQRPWIVNG